MTLKFAVIKFCQRTFFKSISEHQSPWNKLLIEASTFPEQYRLYWNESSHFEAATFSRKDFFQIGVCSSYFLLITTSWWQILFLISYFFKINTFSAQLLSRRDFFFRISNYSEHVLFRKQVLLPNSHFFRRSTFLAAAISWKQSLFVIVLRNQFHSIYTWKDFPLTSIHSFKRIMIWSDLEIL